MAPRKKLTDPVGVETAEKHDAILFKVNRPLTDTEHDMLMRRMREQEKHLGMKIVVIPHAVDHVDGEA